MNLENKKQVAILSIAVGLGVVAVAIMGKVVAQMVEKEREAITAEMQKKNAVVINELELVKDEMRKMVAQQQQLAQQQQQIKEQAIAAAEEASRKKAAEAAGGVIDSTVFAMMTPPGKRAITIEIESLSAVGGLVNPGDFVDVIAHLEVPIMGSMNSRSLKDLDEDDGDDKDKKKNTVTTVLFQNVQVLAVGANFKPVGNSLVYEAQTKAKMLNVTLALDPDQAPLITFAKQNGELQLSLRSPSEKSKHLLEVASWDAISQYVLDHQGTELDVPSQQTFSPDIKTSGEAKTGEVKPFIQIYRGGQAL